MFSVHNCRSLEGNVLANRDNQDSVDLPVCKKLLKSLGEKTGPFSRANYKNTSINWQAQLRGLAARELDKQAVRFFMHDTTYEGAGINCSNRRGKQRL
jgi:hypothetical protein